MRLAMMAVVAALCAGPVTARAAPDPIESAAPAIEAIFSRWMADNHVPGMIYGVVAEGRLVVVHGLGVQDLDERRAVDAETRFRIASMTKAFTAMAVLTLRDKGVLGLDDRVEKFVPELRGWHYPTSDSPRLTIRDLLHHVAGFVTDDPWGDRQTPLPQDAFTALLAQGVPFARVPEAKHEYANLGYAILGRVIANASGMTYRGYVEQTLLQPLGMADSGYDWLALPRGQRALGYRWENETWTQEPVMPDGAFNAMGGLSVSARDYARWLAFVLQAWPARDGADAGPVQRGSVRQIAEGLNFQTAGHRLSSDGAAACPGASAYGLGWRTYQDCEFGLMLHHGGGYPGYGSHVLVLPEFGVALFALTNKTYAGPVAPVWDSAELLLRKGLIHRAAPQTSGQLAAFYAAAREVWTSGSVAPLAGKVAMNFAMDRSDANWARRLAELHRDAGGCETGSALVPDGAMEGTFVWPCAKGQIEGGVLLAPTQPITLQALRLTFVPGH